MRTKNLSYTIAKHYFQQHPDWQWGESKPFTMAPVGPSRRGNVERLLEEGVRLEEAQGAGEQLINSKGEWGHLRIKRLAITSSGGQ